MVAVDVQSSTIKKIGYDSSRQVLRVMFQTGSVYEYDNVPPSIMRDIMASPSKGTYFKRNVQGVYDSRRLS